MSPASQVQDRVNAAFRAYQDAQAALNAAVAEQARLTLLEFADESPEIKGLTYEMEYTYDDEGGYFPSVTTYPIVEITDNLEDYFDDSSGDFSDAFYQFGHEALAILCGVPTDSYNGQVTIEEARERRF